MSKMGKYLRSAEGGVLMFKCPGCKLTHCIHVGEGPGPRWTYNGNPDAPSFQPSVLVTGGHYSSHHKPGDSCWCTYNAEHPDDADFECIRCHSYVTDGRIQFLADCSHALAGQTVDLLEI